MERRMRDQRDPQALGERYMIARAKGVDIEYAVDLHAPDYEHNDSLSRETVAQYREDLARQAATGDATAARLAFDTFGPDVFDLVPRAAVTRPQTLAHTNGHVSLHVDPDEDAVRLDVADAAWVVANPHPITLPWPDGMSPDRLEQPENADELRRRHLADWPGQQDEGERERCNALHNSGSRCILDPGHSTPHCSPSGWRW